MWNLKNKLMESTDGIFTIFVGFTIFKDIDL